MSDGMSLYSLQGNPAHPIAPVITIAITQAGMRYLHFGMFRADGRSRYSSASFMPRQNSHRYCRKKLFHTRSSPNPSMPTIVAHSRLMARATQYPPY